MTRLGASTVGFSYVQGAGDDDELWSRVGGDLVVLIEGTYSGIVSQTQNSTAERRSG